MNDNHDQIEPATQMTGPGADWRTTWTPSRRHFLTLTGLALGGAALGLGVSACGTAQTGTSAGQAEGTCWRGWRDDVRGRLPMGSAEELQPAWRLNPDWPTNVQAGNQSQFIYETLLRFNLLDGSLSPGLAKELQQPDDHTFVLPLQDGTKWSDGSDLTADDVVFTFELGKTAPVTFATLWQYIDSVKATDPRTVEFKVKSKPYNPIIVKNFIASVAIVPKAVFGSISPDKISVRDEPEADRLRPVLAG